jgi:uncharacterized RDD family membrane protein YckC
MLYEAFLLTGALFVIFLAPNVALGMLAHYALPGGWLAVHALLSVAVYFLWFWRRSGQTLAMKTWKIRLTTIDGRRPSWDQLILRFMLAWPSVLTTAGLLWAVFDRDRQFLHDRLSGTRIEFIG